MTFSGQESNWRFDPNPLFDHNLCFNYPNGSCEPILDIYVPKSFQWYKELLNPITFDPYNCPLKIWESIGTTTSKVGAHLGVWGFIPSHSLTFLGAWNVTPGLTLDPHLCKPLPKARVVTNYFIERQTSFPPHSFSFQLFIWVLQICCNGLYLLHLNPNLLLGLFLGICCFT